MIPPFSQGANLIYTAITIAQWVILAVGLIHVIRTRPDAYTATGKQSKKFWLAVLGIFLVITLTIGGGLSLVGIAATVAGIVYLVDVKPAIDEILRRR
ncbi:MAG TPA: DUF2516 family protein [Candidatus Nanopelagicaceae bacterium]|nr:DUF2516 family protein [Candidatus Nanopelagicaceae bacterium]